MPENPAKLQQLWLRHRVKHLEQKLKQNQWHYLDELHDIQAQAVNLHKRVYDDFEDLYLLLAEIKDGFDGS